MHTKNTSVKGFTIVELLIVIVVIAILAAITIVSYNGISSRSRQAAMQANIEQVSKSILSYRALNGSFPANLAALNDGVGTQSPSDSKYTYTQTGTSYCLTISSLTSSDRYYISDTTGKIQPGTCAGQEGLITGYPTRGGYTDITLATAPNDSLRADVSSVPTGSWMIVVLSYTNQADAIPPAGWAILVARKETGTMQTSIYAKIKQPGDAAAQDFNAGGSNGEPTTTGALLWGDNAAAIGSWVVGSFGDRAVNATDTTAVTPTVSVTTAKALVLSIATERTSALETNYTSLTGVTPWVWVQQPSSVPNKMQTIAIGYDEQASTGTSKAMTVTYPNPQTSNATAVQLIIPPAS